MNLIGIADSGSTKTDFVFINLQGQVVFRKQTIGFNPLFLSSQDVLNGLHAYPDLMDIAKRVTKIYFYGAGVRTEKLKKNIQQPFSQAFHHAEVQVDSDMTAAAYAAYNGKPTLVCILGTGSNVCFFDGKNITKEIPSLGYVLGDEGSGNHLGRQLIRAFFSKKLPKNIHQKFQEAYPISPEKLLEKVYQTSFPNAYLAKFSSFIAENKHEIFIQKMIEKSFDDFIQYQILPYPQAKQVELNFIGSIAFYYQNILKQMVRNHGLTFGKVIQKPIDALVDYHVKHLL